MIWDAVSVAHFHFASFYTLALFSSLLCTCACGMQATQRALLRSSSSSGFIARQVAAAKTRFKELTLPELR